MQSKRQIKTSKSQAEIKIEAQIKKGKELAKMGSTLYSGDSRDRDNFEILFDQWVDFTYENLKEIFVSYSYAQNFKEKHSSKVHHVGSSWIPDIEYYLEKQLVPKIDFLEILRRNLDQFDEVE